MTETMVQIQTSFKIAKVNPLDDLKAEFMAEYADQPEILKNAGLI